MSLEERIKKAKKRLKEFELVPENYVVGVYKGVKEIDLKGKLRILHRIQPEGEEEEIGIWSTAVLDEELKRAGVKIGDTVAIKYLGKMENKRYHDWIVLKGESEE